MVVKSYMPFWLPVIIHIRKMKLRLNILLIISICFFGCNSSSYLSKKENVEKEKVTQCRKNWNFKPLVSETPIEILLHDKKGRHDLVSWPNFFIGIDSKGDTIGVIEYESELDYKKGDIVVFFPGQRKNSISEQLDSEMDEPVFTVRKKSKENDLYCSVELIYYGKLKK